MQRTGRTWLACATRRERTNVGQARKTVLGLLGVATLALVGCGGSDDDDVTPVSYTHLTLPTN